MTKCVYSMLAVHPKHDPSNASRRIHKLIGIKTFVLAFGKGLPVDEIINISDRLYGRGILHVRMRA
ncbi:MAG: hypothetical protein DHS20C16_17850 [Phycisphaerae bacterium]|nr:MAG: hypothetical protein DHS20C16_17850 [Phycisphaerae bacterium]